MQQVRDHYTDGTARTCPLGFKILCKSIVSLLIEKLRDGTDGDGRKGMSVTLFYRVKGVMSRTARTPTGPVRHVRERDPVKGMLLGHGDLRPPMPTLLLGKLGGE